MIKHQTRLSAFFAAFFLVILTQTAYSQELRLIQYGPGPENVAWMSETETTAISRASHEAGHCGGYFDITDHADKQARGEPEIYRTPEVEEQMAEGPRHPEIVTPLLAELSAANLHATVEHLAAYETRYYTSPTGVASAQWIKSQFEAYASGRSDITVTAYNHSFDQPSVVARIAGAGPHAGEIVVIGGHEDSIHQTWFGGDATRAPGADDNASGTATVLEVFRVLAQSSHRPDRTLEFMTYAGEEKGLLGSQDIAEHYREQSQAVVAAMQFDMTMFPAEAHRITFITDHTDATLNAYVESLVDAYVKFQWTTSTCGYACSDHASWTSAGYAAVFPFEAPMGEDNPHIHTPGDVQGILDDAFGLNFAKTGLAFAVEMGTP